MASTTGTKRSARSKNMQADNTQDVSQSEDIKVDTESVVNNDTKAKTKTTKKIVSKDIDPNQYINVKNGYQGSLIYTSRRTGEKFIWDRFGADQEIELRELKSAKNSSRKFFINNWFMFDEDDDWVIDYLGVRQFYKYAISIENFDNIFAMKASDLKEAIGRLSNGQKRSVAYRAKELIDAHEIDSLSVINALEDALGTTLIEK